MKPPLHDSFFHQNFTLAPFIMNVNSGVPWEYGGTLQFPPSQYLQASSYTSQIIDPTLLTMNLGHQLELNPMPFEERSPTPDYVDQYATQSYVVYLSRNFLIANRRPPKRKGGKFGQKGTLKCDYCRYVKKKEVVPANLLFTLV
jgi:hypothetical protein